MEVQAVDISTEEVGYVEADQGRPVGLDVVEEGHGGGVCLS